MQSLDDGALARRISDGSLDDEAESELYRRFASRVRLYGLRHLRDEAAAEDLVQDVLTLVLESLRAGRVRDGDQLASFVLGSCRNVVMNQRRRDGRRRALLAQLASEQPETHAAAVPNADAELADCLARLAERERTVIVLSYYAERDGAHIARELGLSAGNVRVIRHRALSRLLGCMEAAG